ncbi:uncharacterized protein LOC142590417 [Dermacentor variabilis]|uniref:uncharacterized protein LOC142590417 n=1 Tax=Dermacentor variabilis TaxID=34621 RepID=UPI003F5B7B5D
MKPNYKPGCKMTLAFTPTGDRCFQNKSLFWSSSSSTAISHRFMHWEFYCKFTDGKCFKIEALQDKNNLMPSMTPAVSLPPDQVFLGDFERSYPDVCEAYYAMCKIEEYDVVENNCQTWLVAFLEKLQLPLPGKVRTIAKTIEKIFSDHGKGNAYHFVVKTVRDAYELLLKPRDTTAPEEKEQNNNVEDDNEKNENRISQPGF